MTDKEAMAMALETWKQKFARLQNLMDVREIQPNKPCCLAARADEREACAKLCDQYDVAEDVNTCDTAEGIALAIRARGQS